MMAAEYETAKEEALERLRAECRDNLHKLQDSNIQAEFSFRQDLGWQKTSQAIHPRSPILRKFSQLTSPFSLQTWAKYAYQNGSVTCELVQNQSTRNLYGEKPKTVRAAEDYAIESIPFESFSENDLVTAAKAIEIHLPPRGEVSIAS